MNRDNSPGHLSMPDTPPLMRECLDSIPDPVVSRGLTLFNCLMSGLTEFSLKIPSLLEFNELVRANEISARTPNHNACFVLKFGYSGLAGILLQSVHPHR